METTAAKPEVAAPKRLREQMRETMVLLRYKRNSIAQYLGYCYQFAQFHHRDLRVYVHLARKPAECIKSPLDAQPA